MIYKATHISEEEIVFLYPETYDALKLFLKTLFMPSGIFSVNSMFEFYCDIDDKFNSIRKFFKSFDDQLIALMSCSYTELRTLACLYYMYIVFMGYELKYLKIQDELLRVFINSMNSLIEEGFTFVPSFFSTFIKSYHERKWLSPNSSLFVLKPFCCAPDCFCCRLNVDKTEACEICGKI